MYKFRFLSLDTFMVVGQKFNGNPYSVINFDSIPLLISININDTYGEDAERLPMKKLCKVCLEKSAIDIGVKKVK